MSFPKLAPLLLGSKRIASFHLVNLLPAWPLSSPLRLPVLHGRGSIVLGLYHCQMKIRTQLSGRLLQQISQQFSAFSSASPHACQSCRSSVVVISCQGGIMSSLDRVTMLHKSLSGVAEFQGKRVGACNRQELKKRASKKRFLFFPHPSFCFLFIFFFIFYSHRFSFLILLFVFLLFSFFLVFIVLFFFSFSSCF